MRFVLERVAMGQVLSKYFCSPLCQYHSSNAYSYQKDERAIPGNHPEIISLTDIIKHG
jgi:hypothetical protein